MHGITLTLRPETIKAVRTLNAQINGSLGGKIKTRNRAAASRRNLKRALRARKMQLAAA